MLERYVTDKMKQELQKGNNRQVGLLGSLLNKLHSLTDEGLKDYPLQEPVEQEMNEVTKKSHCIKLHPDEKIKIIIVDGVPKSLSTGEKVLFNIILTGSKEKPVSTQHIMEKMEMTNRSEVGMLISRLRKKIEKERGRPEIIKRFKGRGYFIDADIEKVEK